MLRPATIIRQSVQHLYMLRVDPEDESISLTQTSIAEQDCREEHLREWIIDEPEHVLGEDVLLIGREVKVKGIGDGIDLLAVDRDGNTVIIELKQGRITGNVDFQALKYAAYTSHWSYEQLREQFESFKQTRWGTNLYDEETTFKQALDGFCNDEYTPNQDQRILLVGESLAERLDFVSRWLSDHDVDISVVEVQLFEDDGRIYLDAEQTVPVPNRSTSEVSPDTSEKPWKKDGRSWHLNEVASDETAELLERVVSSLSEIEFLDGPHWGQQQYVSFKQDRKNRVLAYTQKTLFHLEIYDISVEGVDASDLGEAIGVEREDVTVEEDDLRDGRPGVGITCRGGQEIDVSVLADEARRLFEVEPAVSD